MTFERKQRFFLSDMELDEISTVALGDNPTADILIMKSCGHEGVEKGETCPDCGEIAKGGSGKCTCTSPKPGRQTMAATMGLPRCPDCGGATAQRMAKSMPGPDTLHHDKPLDDEDFKYAKKLKGKKKMSVMRKQALVSVQKMAAESRRHIR